MASPRHLRRLLGSKSYQPLSRRLCLPEVKEVTPRHSEPEKGQYIPGRVPLGGAADSIGIAACSSDSSSTPVFSREDPWRRAAHWQTPVAVGGLSPLARGARQLSTSEVPAPPLFRKLLVANRGEIACRVMRTARRLGIPTVAIFSAPDRESLHVRVADEAVCVGPAAPGASYLNMSRVLDAVRETGATAVHPGYGFLSENAAFVQRLREEAQGVTFVGPTAEAIHAMGDKIESKQLARAAGVNTIPGVEEVIRDTAHALAIAREVGFPVMLKASGGGGGKGMRIARDAQEVEQHFNVCRAEAESSFADPRIFIERYIEQPRHIEIQVVGDKHGNVVWLPERECSIQRRNQKIIEEAPSPFLDEGTRRAMGEQAVALAQAVNYDSAGTVEFLVDKDKNFFFLEMNTRLQVEHPVTECITGLDLVEVMLRVATGAPLTSLTPSLALSQDRASRISGWAMEARICCEQPGLMFLPSTGFLRTYEEPRAVCEVDEVVRVDSGVTEGDEVTMHYDPLIAKVITWTPERGTTITAMEEALDQYFVQGPSNNIAFIRCVTAHPEFAAGNLSTQFLPQYFPSGAPADILEDARLTREAAAVSVLLSVLGDRYALSAALPREALVKPSVKPLLLTVLVEGRPIDVAAEYWPVAHDESLLFMEVEFPEERILVTQRFPWGGPRGGSARGTVELDVDGKATFCQIVERLPRGFRMIYKGHVVDKAIVMPRDTSKLQKLMPKPKVIDTTRLVKSPMPGAIVGIAVAFGQKVVPGEELVTIEAMKMRNVLRAEREGVVKGVFITMGQLVKPGDNLVEIE